MFGFVVADVENLSAEEKKIYGAYFFDKKFSTPYFFVC